MNGVIFAHNGPYGGMPILLKQVASLRSRGQDITSLLRRIGCAVSQTTVGTETRRVHCAKGAGGGACNAPLPCLCMLPMAVVGPLSTLRYIMYAPVLWMTSCLHIMASN